MELRTFPAGFGEPSYSPFCVKGMCLLALSCMDWRPTFVDDPSKEPKGKLPVLVDGDQTIADSAAIRAHLEARSGRDFDEGLSDAERAAAHALIRMAEGELYFQLLRDRWIGDDAWAATKRSGAFDGLPPIIRTLVPPIVRRKIRRDLAGQGMLGFSEEEVADRAMTDFRAIAATLGDKPFLFGDAPTSADASVGSMVNGLLASRVETPLRGRLASVTALAEYGARVRAALYPAQ